METWNKSVAMTGKQSYEETDKIDPSEPPSPSDLRMSALLQRRDGVTGAQSLAPKFSRIPVNGSSFGTIQTCPSRLCCRDIRLQISPSLQRGVRTAFMTFFSSSDEPWLDTCGVNARFRIWCIVREDHKCGEGDVAPVL
ncbi:hypothetical protein AOLI_G00293540 [Acnodon oligacanthus]